MRIQKEFFKLKAACPRGAYIEEDHMDYFKDSRDVADAYDAFLKNIKEGGKGVINGDEESCRRLSAL
jgi:UDP-N-acetylmuramate-alanine ligase